MQTGVQISIAAGLDYGVGYALDGAALSNFYDAKGLPLPFPDALQEFKVETSSLTAMNGTHSAGSVNAVTRSGSNAFHSPHKTVRLRLRIRLPPWFHAS
jgi:hypothetical protein